MRNKGFSVSIIILLVVALGIAVWNRIDINTGQSEIYFVDNHKVFDEFTMTKEYDNMMGSRFNQKEAFIDSLKFEIKLIEKQMKSDTSKAILQDYYRKRNQFAEISEQVAQEKQGYIAETKAKIWKRLNALIIQYGEQNNCKLILGASGNGNIMFGEEQLNRTQQVIDFINTKYNSADGE